MSSAKEKPKKKKSSKDQLEFIEDPKLKFLVSKIILNLSKLASSIGIEHLNKKQMKDAYKFLAIRLEHTAQLAMYFPMLFEDYGPDEMYDLFIDLSAIFKKLANAL